MYNDKMYSHHNSVRIRKQSRDLGLSFALSLCALRWFAGLAGQGT
jgi:hypothetical protein